MSGYKITGEYADLESLHRAGHRTTADEQRSYQEQMVRAIESLGEDQRRREERDAELDHERKVAEIRKAPTTAAAVSTHSNAELEFSDDYRRITFNGQVRYRLTSRQAAIIRVVHQNPYCEASTQIIKKLAGCSQIRDSFRAGDGPKIWKKVIVPSDHPRGFYRLKLTPKK